MSLRSLIFGDEAGANESRENVSQVKHKEDTDRFPVSTPSGDVAPVASTKKRKTSNKSLGDSSKTKKVKSKSKSSKKRDRTSNGGTKRKSSRRLRQSILKGEDGSDVDSIELENGDDEDSDGETEPAVKKSRLDPKEDKERLDILYASASATDAQAVHKSLHPAPLPPRKKHILSQEQQAKRDRSIEWMHIRVKWKARKYDMRQEQDVGGAIERLLRNSKLPPRRRTVEPATAEAVAAQAEASAQKEETAPEPHVDTSDEEEDNILSQLLQGSQKNKEEKMSAENKPEDFNTPYSERLGYWELGENCPDVKAELAVYGDRLREVIPNNTQKRGPKNMVPLDPGEVLSLYRARNMALPGSRNASEIPTRYYTEPVSWYLPINHENAANIDVLHARQLSSLIARHLITSSNPDCLRLLWQNMSRSTGMADRDRWHNMVRRQTTTEGNFYKVFWSYAWKDRWKAAELLLDPAHRVYKQGRSGNSAPEFRAKVIKKYVRRTPDGKPEKIHYDMATPNCTYVPVPGTAPPVPYGPLDATEVMLGPADKTMHYIQGGQLVLDESTYRLTLAALHRECLDQIEVREQLDAMASKLIEQMKDADLPSSRNASQVMSRPMKYRAYMGYVSLALNGGLDNRKNETKQENDDEAFQEAQIDFLQEETVSIDADFPATCKRLHEYLGTALEQSGAESFARLRCVHGLLRIAKDLPEPAALLLSHALDEKHFRTPFEQIAGVLQYLEDENLLVENKRKVDNESAVGVEELEYALHQASDVFAVCVECEPTELQYRCWHLAALAGCLLLCSGHLIGSGAHIHPSPSNRKYEDDHNLAFEMGGDDKFSSSFAKSRLMLAQFHALRRDTARAFHVLCHLATKQSNLSSNAHLVVSSFLEWREVVALLLGPDSSPEVFDSVRTVHRYHFTRWAHRESLAGHPYLLRREVGDKARLESLARAVESDPGDRAHWRALATELGPIGRKRHANDETSACSCKVCALLVEDRCIDHHLEQKKGKIEWWGRDRREWWSYSVFDMDNVGVLWRQNGVSVQDKVGTGLPDDLTLESPTPSTNNPVQGGSTGEMQANILEVSLTLDEMYSSFLDVPLALDPESVDDALVRDTERFETVDERLPRTFREEITRAPIQSSIPPLQPVEVDGGAGDKEQAVEVDGDGEDKESRIGGLFFSDWDVLEVTCYQIVVASHLYSPGERWVVSKLYDMAMACWDNVSNTPKRGTNEMQALRWLSLMGLNGAAAIRLAETRNYR